MKPPVQHHAAPHRGDVDQVGAGNHFLVPGGAVLPHRAHGRGGCRSKLCATFRLENFGVLKYEKKILCHPENYSKLFWQIFEASGAGVWLPIPPPPAPCTQRDVTKQATWPVPLAVVLLLGSYGVG